MHENNVHDFLKQKEYYPQLLQIALIINWWYSPQKSVFSTSARHNKYALDNDNDNEKHFLAKRMYNNINI